MTNVDEFIEQQLEMIDDEIQKIDNHKVVRAAQKLLDQKTKLVSARRALLGAGPKMTGGNGTKVTQREVSEWMSRQDEDWFTVSDIAEGMGHSEAVIRGHLNRGSGERFEKNPENNNWRLRDPERDEDD